MAASKSVATLDPNKLVGAFLVIAATTVSFFVISFDPKAIRASLEPLERCLEPGVVNGILKTVAPVVGSYDRTFLQDGRCEEMALIRPAFLAVWVLLAGFCGLVMVLRRPLARHVHRRSRTRQAGIPQTPNAQRYNMIVLSGLAMVGGYVFAFIGIMPKKQTLALECAAGACAHVDPWFLLVPTLWAALFLFGFAYAVTTAHILHHEDELEREFENQ